MASNRAFLLFFSFLTRLSVYSCESYNFISSEDFNKVKYSTGIVGISFIRDDNPLQPNFGIAGDYLKQFGVVLGTVNCLSDPVTEYCHQVDASDNVYIFRHGSFFVTLGHDTLFSVDAIVANILHLVLLVDVPIISEASELLDKQDTFKGKRDIIVGYVPGVGMAADRAFMEVAFAYKHEFVFVTTTNRNLMKVEENMKPSLIRTADPVVAISQCKKAEPQQTCTWAKYHGPVTLEGLAIFMKVLQLPQMIDMFEDGKTDVYIEHGVSALYALTDLSHYEQTLSIIHDAKDHFQGNVGFVVIDRKDVSVADLLAELNMECISVCYVLRSHNQIISNNDIHDALELKEFLEKNMHLVFGYLVNPVLDNDQEEELEDEDDQTLPGYLDNHVLDEIQEEEIEDEEDDFELPVQERQDDVVQEATVHMRLVLEPKKYITPSLTDKTFPEFTGQSQLTSVLFTIQWNPRSLAFLESFESAAQHLLAVFSSDSSEPPLARVECSDWPDVCDSSNVTVYPTVKMYREKSDVATYGGILDKDNYLKSYLLHKLPNPIDLKDADELAKAKEGSYPAPWIKDHMTSLVLAVIPETYKEEMAVFQQVFDELQGEFLFGLCTGNCAQQESSLDKPSANFIKWSDPAESPQTFRDTFTAEKLVAFIKEASLPVLPELTAANMPLYMSRHKSFVILFHTGDELSDIAAQSMKQIATSEIGNQYTLCKMDITDENGVGSQTLTTYGFLPTSDQAIIVILDHALGEVCRFPHGSDPSESAIQAWLQASLESPKRCSEARALIEREWKPLVPPYDFLKFMEDEEHGRGGGRRGIVTHHEEETKKENAEDKKEKETDVPIKTTPKHRPRHIEL